MRSGDQVWVGGGGGERGITHVSLAPQVRTELQIMNVTPFPNSTDSLSLFSSSFPYLMFSYVARLAHNSYQNLIILIVLFSEGFFMLEKHSFITSEEQ